MYLKAENIKDLTKSQGRAMIKTLIDPRIPKEIVQSSQKNIMGGKTEDLTKIIEE